MDDGQLGQIWASEEEMACRWLDSHGGQTPDGSPHSAGREAGTSPPEEDPLPFRFRFLSVLLTEPSRKLCDLEGMGDARKCPEPEPLLLLPRLACRAVSVVAVGAGAALLDVTK